MIPVTWFVMEPFNTVTPPKSPEMTPLLMMWPPESMKMPL